MTARPTCYACAVPIHRGSEYEHAGHVYHVPCLVRSLQGQVDAITEQRLRPHVRDRSVLRGLCQMADVAVLWPEHEDVRAALDWLRETASPPPAPSRPAASSPPAPLLPQ